LKNNSKINTSKGKLYFTIVALAAVLMMSINLNANMNSNMNAYATIISEIPNIDDLGQSAECVIVVVGCDGTGSVGSSGDTIIGSFNGNDDNDTDTSIDPNTPLPPIDPTTCEGCLESLTTTQYESLVIALGLVNPATPDVVCDEIIALETVGELVLVLDEAGFSAQAAVDFMVCLGIDITLADVEAIIAL
jgi:hypothetical protein